MATYEELFKDLMQHEFTTVTDENLLKLGHLIDISTDLRKTEGFDYAKTKITNLLSLNIDNDHKAILYFYFANIWEGLRVPKTKDTQASWDWPFRGLYWLAKDLSEQRTDFVDPIEPDAQNIVKIRNFVEHKFLTLLRKRKNMLMVNPKYSVKCH